jgi:hypothetical protein
VPTEEEAQQFCGGAFKAWNVGTDANDRQILEPGNEDPKRSFNFPINGRSDDRREFTF